LTDEALIESLQTTRNLRRSLDARAGIVDFSCVTQFPVSANLLNEAAGQEPAMGTIPRIIVAPTMVAFGIARMFQIAGEPKTSGLEVVRAMREAYAALGVESPHFEPLA
jgi:hypothetical protein